MSAMVLKAIQFATAKHEGQLRRGSGEPYIVHPIMVSYLLAQYKQSKNIEELICASLLHDTLEDTETTFSEIAENFSPLVASLVLELTSDEALIKELGKNEYLKIKLCGISNYALVIKLADRLANISDQPSDKMVQDTIALLKHLKSNRKLTATQASISRDIICKCNDITIAKRQEQKNA
jgi:guanosine-3',5'-bis(diphosphate) 3'-pyrophosphohydrolase